MIQYLKYLLGLSPYKYAVGTKVIFVNDFGVVYLWTISEQTTYEKDRHGKIVVPAYYHENTQTPWFPTEEIKLFRASFFDRHSTQEKLQERYGFTPTEWYGCY